MSLKIIDGKSYKRMLIGAAARLAEKKDELNSLNVFPVADGDTGTNMLKTMDGGLREISDLDSDSIGEVSRRFSKGVLLSARGNSGVILSQIFAGINEVLEDCNTADPATLAEAYEHGTKRSYASVQNPTEGTILTVFRESADSAAGIDLPTSSVDAFYTSLLTRAHRSLGETKEKLPVLKEADVVDSGAAGYVCIAEGMYESLTGKALEYEVTESHEGGNLPDIDSFTRDSKLEFGYCTEFLLRLTSEKVDPDSFEISTVISMLDELGGESVVAYKDKDIVKVHVHTFRPGEILNRAQNYGEFLTVKIENMSLGHSEKIEKKKAKKKFSVVAVASGDGICALFKEMGADRIVSGGQTANPSIEELVEAFRECDGENIILLPNNKNVILAARQAAEVYKDARVCVVETGSLMQGYGALSVITPGLTDIDAIITSATRAAKSVTDGEITRAVRDVTVNGKEIRKGDYIAITGSDIVATGKSAEDAAVAMLEGLDTDLAEIITVFTGKDVTEESRAAFTERLEDIYPDCEVEIYTGGQEVYDYLISVE